MRKLYFENMEKSSYFSSSDSFHREWFGSHRFFDEENIRSFLRTSTFVDEICQYQTLSDSVLFDLSFRGILNWKIISKYQVLTNQRVRMLRDVLDFDIICQYGQIPASILMDMDFSHLLNWDLVSRYQVLSETDIRSLRYVLNFKLISKYQILPTSLILDLSFRRILDWTEISANQELSEDVLRDKELMELLDFGIIIRTKKVSCQYIKDVLIGKYGEGFNSFRETHRMMSRFGLSEKMKETLEGISKYYFEWSEICECQELEEWFIEEFRYVIDWSKISIFQCHLPESFLLKWIDWLDIHSILRYRKDLSPSFILHCEKKIKCNDFTLHLPFFELLRKYDTFKAQPDYLNWIILSRDRNVPPSIIRKYIDFLELGYLAKCQRVPEDIIELKKDEINWDFIILFQNLSIGFLQKHCENYIMKKTETKGLSMAVTQNVSDMDFLEEYMHQPVIWKMIHNEKLVFHFLWWRRLMECQILSPLFISKYKEYFDEYTNE